MSHVGQSLTGGFPEERIHPSRWPPLGSGPFSGRGQAQSHMGSGRWARQPATEDLNTTTAAPLHYSALPRFPNIFFLPFSGTLSQLLLQKQVIRKALWFKARTILYFAHDYAPWAGHSEGGSSWFLATLARGAQREDLLSRRLTHMVG